MQYDQFELIINNNCIEKIQELYINANDIYYNTGEDTGLTDEQFDILKDILIERDIKIHKVGHQLRNEDNKVVLPYRLMSMNKATTNKQICNWIENKSENNSDHVIEAKLDGVSANLVIENNKYSLYTRGDGNQGSDISYLIKYISNIPVNVECNISIRGELIVPKSIFNIKYSSQFSNARNMVSGCVNAKTLKDGVSDMKFISYEIIAENNYCSKPTDQFDKLKQLSFECVDYKVCKLNTLNIQDTCIEILTSSRTADYEIDGIIVQLNKEYKRACESNPDYAIAYKKTFNENIKVATVQEVLWDTTKYNILKPRVRITPVYLNGVTITYLTAYNAKYVYDNNISSGTVLEITRSGDVIPKIVRIIEHSSTNVDMPDIDWKWNDTNVDIINLQTDDNTSIIKQLSFFFEQLNVKHIGLETIKKLYNNGFVSILKIIKIKKGDIINIKGFEEQSESRIIESINNIRSNTDISQLLTATGVFGRGIGLKKIQTLLESVPDLLHTCEKDYDIVKERMMNISGFSAKTVSKICSNIKLANDVITELGDIINITYEYSYKQNDHIGVFTFSGFRSDIIKDKLIKRGYVFNDSLTKDTTLLVVSDKMKGKSNNKINKAVDLNIEILYESDI